MRCQSPITPPASNTPSRWYPVHPCPNRRPTGLLPQPPPWPSRALHIGVVAGWYGGWHSSRRPCSSATPSGSTSPADLKIPPAYLPAVPLDPFASNATPLRYLRGEPDPRVYSVGDNDRDDGDSDHTTRTDADRWHRDDAVVHLHLQPRDPAHLHDAERAPDPYEDLQLAPTQPGPQPPPQADVA